MAPDGLRYVASWVANDFTRCYQVMESDDQALVDQWIANWADIVDFDVIPVVPSAEAVATIAPALGN